jgi:hypothetical protein
MSLSSGEESTLVEFHTYSVWNQIDMLFRKHILSFGSLTMCLAGHGINICIQLFWLRMFLACCAIRVPQIYFR